MSTNDWKREMEHMLEMFDRQATQSLRKINGHFETLRRPFNEEFRQYFLKISNERLGMSYTKIEIESWDKQQAGLAESHDDSLHEHQNENRSCAASMERKPIVSGNNDGSTSDNVVEIPECVVVDPLDAVKIEKTEDASDLIEIFDSSDDDDEMANTADLASMEQKQDTMNKGRTNVSAKILNGSNGSENRRSDNNGSNTGSGSGAGTSFGDQQNKTQQSSSSSTVIKRSKRKGGKRIKCNQCPSSFHVKSQLKVHQKSHIREKSMGIVRDSNGLYSCIHCTRKFQKFSFLRIHMARCHKNDQYLLHCANCRSPFTREIEKNAHESQCQRRRYECYLCKSFDTVSKYEMEEHLAMHSGIKRYQCTVCNKRYRLRKSFKYHLNFVHGKKAQQH